MVDLSNNPLCRPFEFKRSKQHGVLLIHGITGTPAHMLPLGRALADAGFTVKGIRLTGHGQTNRAFKKATWRNWIDDAMDAFDELSQTCEKVSVAGLSMGGTLSLLLAEQRPVHCLVPIAAALDVYNRFAKYACLIRWPLNAHIPWGSRTTLQNRPLEEYRLGYSGLYAQNVMGLNKLIRLAKKDLAKITCPILAVRAGQDRSVRPSSAELIIATASSVEKRILDLPNSSHVCVLDVERETLFQEIISFLGPAQN